MPLYFVIPEQLALEHLIRRVQTKDKHVQKALADHASILEVELNQDSAMVVSPKVTSTFPSGNKAAPTRNKLFGIKRNSPPKATPVAVSPAKAIELENARQARPAVKPPPPQVETKTKKEVSKQESESEDERQSAESGEESSQSEKENAAGGDSDDESEDDGQYDDRSSDASSNSS